MLPQSSGWQNPASEITYRPIGHVENSIREPRAPADLPKVDSRITLEPSLIEGLDGLAPGQRLLVVFSFHLAHPFDLHQHPRGDASRPKRGVFSLRSPHRPNPIGITEVTILSIDHNVLCVRGLDAINGTPVLDLKPA